MNEQSIFSQAVELQDPAERSDFLNEACGIDNHLRGRVERLIDLNEKAGSFLEEPAYLGFADLVRG